MRKTIFAAAAALVLVSQGCALFKPMTPEERAAWEKKVAAERLIAQREARMRENEGGMELNGSDILQATQAAEAIIQSNGYSTTSVSYQRGPSGGLSITGTKTTDTDLGTSVGMNVLGNMLGADRGRIVKKKVETTIIWIWPKWNANYTGGEPGKLLFANAGGSHDVTQAGEKINVKELSISQKMALRDAIQARIK